MSSHNNKYLDIIIGQEHPYKELGKVMDNSARFNRKYAKVVEDAFSRVKGGFGLELNDSINGIIELDAMIDRMWHTGWNPGKSNINLFVFDLGCVLAKLILIQFGGVPIFRSINNMNTMSVWWEEKGVEIFPYSLVYQRLIYDKREPIHLTINKLSDQLK